MLTTAYSAVPNAWTPCICVLTKVQPVLISCYVCAVCCLGRLQKQPKLFLMQVGVWHISMRAAIQHAVLQRDTACTLTC
jgi:hypothetical protein